MLEAITEIPFPTKDNLCTRFATQIVLRRAPYVTIKVRILPASKSDEARQKSLRTFGRTLEKLEKLPDLVDEAKVAMGVGVSGTGNRFSRDVLRWVLPFLTAQSTLGHRLLSTVPDTQPKVSKSRDQDDHSSRSSTCRVSSTRQIHRKARARSS